MRKSKRPPIALPSNAPPQPRSEVEVFTALTDLCGQPGYVHALAALCYRDNTLAYVGELKPTDLQSMYSWERLIRTEVTTLLGLMVKQPVDWTLQRSSRTQQMVDQSDKLLGELHDRLNVENAELMIACMRDGTNPFTNARALREAMFYCAESAYFFQLLDLAVRKYEPENAWLVKHRGFTIEQARAVVDAIHELTAEQLEMLTNLRPVLTDEQLKGLTHLPAFCVSAAAVAEESQLATDLVERVLDAFTLPRDSRNEQFRTISDFNALSATPIVRGPNEQFLAIQPYALAEALYDAPFYWMAKDKSYLDTLAKHRGEFTEVFVAEKMASVFGADHVFANVDMVRSKKKVGEIDVLVLWGDRAIIVQAKSKRLTLLARQGDDEKLRDDFEKAVQEAYDQAATCAEHLGTDGVVLAQGDIELVLPAPIATIYVFCIVSDHYPALTFQARQLLRPRVVERLRPPIVTDVFAIDVMTEFLRSPLRFLSFVDRRAMFADQLHASNELAMLGYHLKRNLWVEPDGGLVSVHDDLTADIDIAMYVRRLGLQGAGTPPGVLTHLDGTWVGRIVDEVCGRPQPATIELGLLLLSLSKNAADDVSFTVKKIAERARADHKCHDATWLFGSSATGLTIHVNADSDDEAKARLSAHCERRKYAEKAEKWLGVCVDPTSLRARFGLSLSTAWTQDTAMDRATADMRKPIMPRRGESLLAASRKADVRLGRNDRCPCGSGLKFKKCCLQ